MDSIISSTFVLKNQPTSSWF